MALNAVFYSYDERTELRMEHRPAHRQFISDLYDAGTIVLSGPWADDGPAGAMIMVRADSPAAALAIMDADPLYQAGVVASREVRGYDAVFGPFPA